MYGNHKLVQYDEYCNSCKHRSLKECEYPCDECLAVPATEDSHKPIKYEENK